MNKVLIVGDFPSYFDQKVGTAFVDSSGAELTKMLHEAGIHATECDMVNICTHYVPQNSQWTRLFIKNTQAARVPGKELEAGIARLRSFIASGNYELIITLGEVALWALTGERSITNWRGSQLEYNSIPLIPTYHPRDVMRVWEWRFISVRDLQRAKEILESGALTPDYQFTIRPDFVGAEHQLRELLWRADHDEIPFRLSVDIETRQGHIACVGFAWSSTHAYCIPLMCTENPQGYWAREEEFVLVKLMSQLFTHPNVKIIGQNFIYDSQYFARFWGILPPVYMDTMIAHAVCYPGLPKGLDFLSSIYCKYHRFWKNESKDWSPKLGEEQLWIYNCKDCVVTYEVAQVLEEQIERLGLHDQVQFETDLIEPVLYMMMRGTRIDLNLRNNFLFELMAAMEERERWFENILPPFQLAKSKNAKPWYRSPTQQQKLFYEIYKVPVVRAKGTGRPTCNDQALGKISAKEPLLYPICKMLAEYRSLGVFLSTFVQAPLDFDKRMRCSYNPVGTETFRFNSSADAFGFGTNLQNIPKGG